MNPCGQVSEKQNEVVAASASLELEKEGMSSALASARSELDEALVCENANESRLDFAHDAANRQDTTLTRRRYECAAKHGSI